VHIINVALKSIKHHDLIALAHQFLSAVQRRHSKIASPVQAHYLQAFHLIVDRCNIN
jgi:hypothetical protein